MIAAMIESNRYKRRAARATMTSWNFIGLIFLVLLARVEVDAFSLSPISFRPASCRNLGRKCVLCTPQRRISSIGLNLRNEDDEKEENKNIFERNTADINPDEEFFLVKRFQNADFLEIRRDAVLVSCFVMSRFLVYDILSSTKVTPGWVVQDFIWLSGTFSSAVVLVIYWTIAGLLSRTFESTRPYGPVQVLVNVALCCPIWLATEHLFGFGPSNIGGETLSQAIATGFLGLASFMALSRALTTE